MIQLTRQMWNLANWGGVLEMLRHRGLQSKVFITWTGMERIHYEGMKLIHYESVTENRLPITTVLSWWTAVTQKCFVNRRLGNCHRLGNLEWAANLVTCSAHTAQSGSIPDCDLHGSWRSNHIISDDIMKALPRLVAEEILGLLRDATRTERQIALAEMYRQSYEAVTRLCL